LEPAADGRADADGPAGPAAADPRKPLERFLLTVISREKTIER
jgi:hypothetical protein